MKKGKFIVIDGVDGSGKSTQVKLLKESFKKAVYVHDPGGTETGEAIRKILLGKTPLSPFALFFLFVASRAALVEQVIAPALSRGKNVISDRFDSSSFAYQVCASGHTEFVPLLRGFVQNILKDAKPDAYIILDSNPKAAKKRLAQKKASELNAYDKKPLAYHARVRAGYKKFKPTGSKVYIVNADRTPGEVFKDVLSIVNRIIG